jgi:hypothetical protein
MNDAPPTIKPAYLFQGVQGKLSSTRAGGWTENNTYKASVIMATPLAGFYESEGVQTIVPSSKGCM